jgi:PiT family inorganic phosphate transporter
MWNLIGVLVSTGAVAYGIIALLPHDLVMNVGSGDTSGQYVGFAMIFSLLVSAIIWNVGTWYFGLPVSSTHTLVGAILGVGVAHAIVGGQHWTAGLNWEQIYKVILALLVSPIVGFVASALLLLLLKALVRVPDLYKSPGKDETPPIWIRCILVLTCTLVSFSHGNNDGQKGMGLIMLILIGVLPGAFALQSPSSPEAFQKTIALVQQSSGIFQKQATSPAPVPPPPALTQPPVPTSAAPVNPPTPMASEVKAKNLSPEAKEINDFVKSGKASSATYDAFVKQCATVQGDLAGVTRFEDLPPEKREAVRKDIYLLDDGIGKVTKLKLVPDAAGAKTLKDTSTSLETYTKYIPVWVKVAVALALGLGTMVGWKRVVVTVGEKIGKAHMTYAQGGSAELVAAITILGASAYGWPVSTTHVLSSGIAGTMAANGSGLQRQTLINIVLAWVLTLPVCVFLGATLFSAGLYVLFHVFGIQ